ncbi:hypothetical protein VPHK469_0002 [Vibrio phage K469]
MQTHDYEFANNDNALEIMTPTGFQHFEGITKTPHKGSIHIQLLSGEYFKCSLDHLIKLNDGEFVKAADLKMADILWGEKFPAYISADKLAINLYEPIEVRGGHEYISDGITFHNCSFRGSVGTLIPSRDLEIMISKKPIDEPSEYTKIYARYDPKRRYIGVADVAGGLEQDYSVLTVIDVTCYPYTIAAKYRCNTISPMMFPYSVVDICNAYGECPLLMETNNDVGGQAIAVLWYDLEYVETLMTGSDRKRGGSGLKVGGRDGLPGIKTTSRVRNIGCSNLKALIETGKLEICDLDTMDELGVFVLKNDKYQADEGCHDDCVMPLVLFSWLVKTDWFMDEYERNVSEDMRKSASERAIEDMMPFGGSVGIPDHNVYQENVGGYGVSCTQGSSGDMGDWMNS